MKTIYLRQKRSGNFEFSNRQEATEKFTTKKSFIDFTKSIYDGKIIKATYRMSQTYFYNGTEAYDFIKKNNIF